MVSTDEDTKRKRPISPPILKRKRKAKAEVLPTPAAVEAGNADVTDHLAFYSSHHTSHTRSEHARLTIPSWQALYKRNLNPAGHHFVIHQHDHPVAGTHYDLRLQINETSSCSWAIMYGLPGDPNSHHLNRNATETRVHCLWNHLIESASHATGSLLIWDTGEYEILPPAATAAAVTATRDAELTDPELEGTRSLAQSSEPEKLAAAFERGKIRLRLHGHRLPKDYVLYIRRPRDAKVNDRPPSVRRRRKRVRGGRLDAATATAATDSDAEVEVDAGMNADAEAEQDSIIRRENAYPGANNSIGSIHQRTWYASMDRTLSGFVRENIDGENVWVRQEEEVADGLGWSFYVRGREVERSVLTGRNAADVLADEGVVGFVPRAGWRAVLG